MYETPAVSEAVATQAPQIILPQSEINQQLIDAARAENAAPQAAQPVAENQQVTDQSDAVDATSQDPIPDAEPQIAKETVGEAVIATTRNVIGRGIDNMEQSLPKDPKEKEDALSRPENVAKRSLHAVDFLMDVKADMGGFPELPFSPNDKAVQLIYKGQLITLVSIKGINESTDIFSCQAKDASGRVIGEYIKLPRSEVVDAQIVAEKAGLAKAAPESQRKVVEAGIDALASKVLGTEDPLEGLSNEQLVDLADSANKVNDELALSKQDAEFENASSDGFERRDPIEKWTDQNVSDRLDVIRYELRGKNDKNGEKQLDMEIDDALKEVADKANKQVKDLTPEEQATAARSVVRNRINKDIVDHVGNLPSAHLSLIEQRIHNWIESHPGQVPSQQLVAQMRYDLSREYITAIQLDKVMDPKFMEQVRKKFGWKDLAGLILFLTKDIGVNFAPSPQQHR